MKTLKLVLGILCIIFSVIIFMQSALVGLGNTISDNGEVSGSTGLMLSIAMLASGIVMLATRKNEGKGGGIASAIMLGLTGMTGLASAGTYKDLNVWSVFALIVAAVNVLPLFAKKSKSAEKEEKTE